ncbi:MAG: tail fiber domain-containing protein, partial [Steroidobacteraceae bacterium]
GSANTAVGNSALNANVSGGNNTATGSNALFMNDSGNTGASGNTADGAGAMNYNTTGSSNTAVGWQALQGTPGGASGSNNTGIGVNALFQYSSGSNNIAVGYEAGINLTTGSNNIYIGNEGLAADNKSIRIGSGSSQKKTYIAGIYGESVSGSPVYIASNGQLGTVVSSERFKTAIAPMGSDTAKLERLRPVTFKLKSDAAGTRQYGLIAEEVAKVYPELVIRGENGRIDGVRYDELAPMLLNEVQHQQAQLQQLRAEVQDMQQLKHQIAELQKLVDSERVAMH